MLPQKKKKILLVVPDGVGVRNFIYNQSLLKALVLNNVSVHLAHPFLEKNFFKKNLPEDICLINAPACGEVVWERLLREAKNYGHLFAQGKRDSEIRRNLKTLQLPKNIFLRLGYSLARLVGVIFSSQEKLLWLEKKSDVCVFKRKKYPDVENFIKNLSPDIVFCTHQRSIWALPIILAAKKMNIPTATFIFSWDNLPKGRMCIRPNHYFVWSERMKRELLEYYPDVSPANVWVLGTTQFENHYSQDYYQSREEFFLERGLDLSRPLICFSGDDKLTSPHDQIYLKDLALSIREIPPKNRPQILFRPCPTDKSGRYDQILKEFPEIVFSAPDWEASVDADWSQVIPSIKDTALLANIVRHCDLVVNIGSTMAMDFALFGKPAIYLRYNPENLNSSVKWDIHNIYKFKHFESVHRHQPVHWADSAQALGELVQRVLLNPEEKERERQAWLKEELAYPVEETGKRFAEALSKLSDNPICT